MSRSNYDKPFYVDVGTSIVAVRCASNHDVILEYDHARMPYAIELAEKACDRMNREAEIAKPRRNCDVGTAEEQAERFEDFCLKHIGCADETGGRHCLGCPLEKASNHITQKCELYWAQMPYDGGESNGSK